MKVRHSTIIRRPVGEVFAFVTSLENETTWQPEIEAVHLDGPIEVGATFTEIRRSFGRRFEWLFEITAYERDRRICIRTLSGAMPYEGCRCFEPVAEGTLVIEEGELAVPWLIRPLDPIFSRLSRRPLTLAYGNLKRILEAGI